MIAPHRLLAMPFGETTALKATMAGVHFHIIGLRDSKYILKMISSYGTTFLLPGGRTIRRRLALSADR